MNIRPMDLQVLIPRTTEVAKSQNYMNQQNTVVLEQSAAEWQKLAAARQQQVQHTPKSEGGKIRERSEPKQQNNKQAKKEGSPEPAPKNDEEQLAASDPVRGHTIDIKT